MKAIEKVKLLLLSSILIALIIGLFRLSGIDEKLTNFYQYDNKKINLTAVKFIQPRVDYVATLSQDKDEDFNRKYSTHFDLNEISKIEKFLKLSKQSDFYDIQINAYMMFDNEKINLFQSKRFVKLPSKYKVTPYLIGKLNGYGLDEHQHQNLTKLQEQVFSKKDEFVNTVIERAKLRKSDWLVTNIALMGVGQKESNFLKNIENDTPETLLEKNDIKEIISSLKAVHDNYLGIK
ncbi:MAG: hypothetical protein NTW78_00700 [Campylobacterales bacterium]|nr:hypothetical protein [Campylobacterales bacterium]